MAKGKRPVGPNHTVVRRPVPRYFKVRNRRGLSGTVEIGQGSFRWKGAKKQSFKRIPWARLRPITTRIERAASPGGLPGAAMAANILK